MATENEIIEKWGKTHNIKRVKGTDVNLENLWDGQSVAYGDGKTFHWLLTEKDKQASIDAWENTLLK